MARRIYTPPNTHTHIHKIQRGKRGASGRLQKAPTHNVVIKLPDNW